MVTYVYETIPADGAEGRRFEVRQSIFDPPLTADPATGEPVRRVISGGGNLITQKAKPVAKRHAAACSPNCGCGLG